MRTQLWKQELPFTMKVTGNPLITLERLSLLSLAVLVTLLALACDDPTLISTPESAATSTPEAMATSTPEPTAASAPQATTINTPEPSATLGGASLSVEERFTAISNGDRHTCVLRSDGSPLCWGIIRYGVASEPAGENFIAISISQFHICALRLDGSPFCWGEDHYGEGAPPAGEKFIDISSGHKHTCALRSDGSPLCWGSNLRGQASPPVGRKIHLHQQWLCAYLRTPLRRLSSMLGQSLLAD